MTDENLMLAIQKGDISKAAVLFERYHRRIYYFLGKVSGDYTAAEDLTQQVFEKLIHYKHSFDPDQSFEPWIFRIARNANIDHAKLNSRTKMIAWPDGKEIEDINEYETQEEQVQLLNKAMAALHQDDREILVLTRYEKMKYQDVARLLSTTESNIKVKVFRAMDKLRSEFFKLSSIQ